MDLITDLVTDFVTDLKYCIASIRSGVSGDLIYKPDEVDVKASVLRWEKPVLNIMSVVQPVGRWEEKLEKESGGVKRTVLYILQYTILFYTVQSSLQHSKVLVNSNTSR